MLLIAMFLAMLAHYELAAPAIGVLDRFPKWMATHAHWVLGSTGFPFKPLAPVSLAPPPLEAPRPPLAPAWLTPRHGRFRSWGVARSPSSALLSPFLGEGSPTKIDYRKKGYLYSILCTKGPSLNYGLYWWFVLFEFLSLAEPPF